MSKRFTDSNKWQSWFRKLPSDIKLAWIYILDGCDVAGVWEPDFELANVCIGEKVNWDKAKIAFGDRVYLMTNGKWWIPKFVSFQCGETLSVKSAPHLKVMKMLKAHGLWDLYFHYQENPFSLSNTLSNTLSDRVSNTLEEEEEDKEEEREEEKKSGIELEIYEAYPKKKNKEDALKAISKALKKLSGSELLARTKRFAELRKTQDPQFTPYPASWFNAGGYEDPEVCGKREEPGACGISAHLGHIVNLVNQCCLHEAAILFKPLTEELKAVVEGSLGQPEINALRNELEKLQ